MNEEQIAIKLFELMAVQSGLMSQKEAEKEADMYIIGARQNLHPVTLRYMGELRRMAQSTVEHAERALKTV